MPTNPFEDPEGVYCVLRNDEGQYSLWPTYLTKPAGWEIVHADDSRAACLDYVKNVWCDMRPLSLVRLMDREEEED